MEKNKQTISEAHLQEIVRKCVRRRLMSEGYVGDRFAELKAEFQEAMKDPKQKKLMMDFAKAAGATALVASLMGAYAKPSTPYDYEEGQEAKQEVNHYIGDMEAEDNFAKSHPHWDNLNEEMLTRKIEHALKEAMSLRKTERMRQVYTKMGIERGLQGDELETFVNNKMDRAERQDDIRNVRGIPDLTDDIIWESLHKVMNEGAANQQVYNDFEDIRNEIGDDALISELYNWLNQSQLEGFIEWIRRNYELRYTDGTLNERKA